MAHRARSVRFAENVELRPTSAEARSASPAVSTHYLSPDTAYGTSHDVQQRQSHHPNQTNTQPHQQQQQQQPSQLRPRRSLVMRGRIRRLEPDYGYDTGLPEHAPLPQRVGTRKSSLPFRTSQEFRPSGAGDTTDDSQSAIGGGVQRKPSRLARWFGAKGVEQDPQRYTAGQSDDALILVDHDERRTGSPVLKSEGWDKEGAHDNVGSGGEVYEMQTKKHHHLRLGHRGYESLDSIDKLDNDSGILVDPDDHQHHHHHHGQHEAMQRKRSLVDRLHGNRPDRHLFPYRSSKENWHAVRTFFRRFFLILLVFPAYLIPYIMTKKAIAEAEAKGGDDGHGGDGAHGPELSKCTNLFIFIFNMLCMMHLGKAAGACLEELVPKFGAHVVSVFDAMTSSTVEMAVAAFALKKGLIRVVQAAMLGAILNNLLLILGITIVVGGYYHKEQELQPDTTQTGMNILMLATISFVVPVTLSSSLTEKRKQLLPPHLEGTELIDAQRQVRYSVDHDILTLSKILAIILLFIYAACLSYQYMNRHFLVTPEDKHTEEYTVHHRHTHYWFAGLAYVVVLGFQIYSANLLVHAVEALGRQYHLNDAFVGFILLPIVLVADLQEEVIAIKESKHGRLDRSVALMIGSCMQIALLVTPLLVILGWIIGEPMNFRFTIMESTILVASVLLVNYLIQDSKTNYLEGVLLLASFLLAAIAFYYDKEPFSILDAGHSIGGDSPEGGGGH
ncbi:hypothetical protein BGW42_006840 [Actinomortierella wolfii]|nr:hypothetical protein BGW42_006840 [Actinomortierella wolfii]